MVTSIGVLLIAAARPLGAAPPMSAPGQLVRLPPNRVWRTYQGGRTLDRLAGANPVADRISPRTGSPPPPAPSTPAANTSPRASPRFARPDSTPRNFAELLASDPIRFLGAAHVARFGASPQLLVKLLDPSIRLHFQVHPTAEFAQKFLNASSGKTEAYHILAVRDDLPHAPYLYLGFQRPPSREELRRMIETQDIAALEACFDKIPVSVGDTFIVPGGVPHALGRGCCSPKFRRPSDLVVRFEFERGGHVLPESRASWVADSSSVWTYFDLTPWPLPRVRIEANCPPRRRRALGVDSYQGRSDRPGTHAVFSRAQEPRPPRPSCATRASASSASSPPAPPRSASATRSTRCRPSTNFSSRPRSVPGSLTPTPTFELLECYPPAA